MTAFADAANRVRDGADHRDQAVGLVAQLTPAEKLDCLDGDTGFWPGVVLMSNGGYNTQAWPAAHVERLGIPGIDFIDGPRGCVVGPATTFPVSMARGASFDPALEYEIGQAMGAELRASGATYTGAVCMNLLRHPAWGRAQETYGEDPHHVGELAAALTGGLQEHVMACMKHYALNSMENARFSVDVTADERTLHEVYLPHFKRVADAGVASVMTAYNAVNGEWCGQHKHLITDILRDEWGWDGFVITDFVAGLRDPVLSVQAGCNIEMPFRMQRAVALEPAIESGDLLMADVNARLAETIATLLRFAAVFESEPDPSVIAGPEHRELAHRAAVESVVLLRNDGGLLPLAAHSLQTVAVLGPLAVTASLGDAGSSNVAHTPTPVAPLAGLRTALPNASLVHSDDDASIGTDADVVVVVVGYTKADEGEYIGDGMNDAMAAMMPPMDHPLTGFDDPAEAEALGAMFAGGDGSAAGGDRDSLRLRPEDEALIAAARAHNDRVVVAVVAGSAVVMPWLETVPAALMLWYAGSEGGPALADVLLGHEPGGRLPFAIPSDESHLVPFDKDATECTYGLLHGQWYLDANEVPAHLPFGFGLSYTSWSIDSATAAGQGAAVTVTNTGDQPGSTVVQVYASVPDSAYERPLRRLVGFAKAHLDAGESAELPITLDLAQLAVRINGEWVTEDQPIELSVGFDAASTQPVAGPA
ncbi:MAG: beta-glucosidase [Acidimicrobiales bacterium]|nr:beta-glucosidase [Acidimicrobiales bacterium]